MNPVNPAARAALDTIEEIDSALQGAIDLMSPETDLHCVDRNNVTTLFRYLHMQHHHALQSLRTALAQGDLP